MNPEKLSLRPVTKNDCQLLWKWRNEAGVRAASFDSKFISYKNHQSWFRRKLRDPKSRMLILLNSKSLAIGQMKFKINHSGIAEIDISIDKNERGKLYGTVGLRLGCKYAFQKFRIDKIKARVKEDNLISLRVFAKIGFSNCGLRQFKNQKYYELSLTRDQLQKNMIGYHEVKGTLD